MRTAEIRAFGIDNIAITDRPDPKPGAGQVLVRMHAFSLNYRDIMVAEGTYNPKLRMPLVPLSDGAGEVVEVGGGVTRWKPCDRVMGAFMQTWIDGPVTEDKSRSALGGSIDGVASEYVLFDEEGLVGIPEHLSYEEASTLPCAGVTAWRALMFDSQLHASDKVLLLGTGGVSIFGLQFARMMNADVIITSSSEEKLARAAELGATSGLNYREQPEWGKAARELSGGIGVDNVLEVGGAGTLPQSVKAVRMGGVISLIGILTGGGDVSIVPLFMRSIRLNGIFVGSRTMFEKMAQAVAAKRIRPVIDRVFAFTELQDALHYMKTGAHFGKIVVKVD